MDNNSRLFKKKKLFDMWKPLKQGGPVTVPWTVDSELNQTKIEDAIMELEKVLGCFSFPKVSIRVFFIKNLPFKYNLNL